MRLVTRGDLDGLTCAVLISECEEIEEIELVHPQQIADRTITIGPDDILANLPFAKGCAKWFDHHLHTAGLPPLGEFDGKFGEAPSAARLVYEYYGGPERLGRFDELVRETDRVDSADLTESDILDPQGFVLLGFTIDGRTGLGEFEGYFRRLVERLREDPTAETILADPAVEKRVELMRAQDETFKQELRASSVMDANVVVTDFRAFERPPVGNRFLIYALFPEANVSVRIQWGPNRSFPVLTMGHSITNRTCNTNLGELAARYGGGGHRGAASVPLLDDPTQQVRLIIAELKANG